MDNITTTTIALEQYNGQRLGSSLDTSSWNQKRQSWRHSKPRYWHKNNRESFERWIDALTMVNFYVFHRVTGPCEITAQPHHQIKLSLTPQLLIEGSNSLFPLFIDPFTVFAKIYEIEQHPASCPEGWISIKGTIANFTRQYIRLQVPEKHQRKARAFLKQVIMPITAKHHSTDSHKTDFFSSQEFYKFHMFYHPSKKYDQRYGFIDRMWDHRNKELQLNLPPNLIDF